MRNSIALSTIQFQFRLVFVLHWALNLKQSVSHLILNLLQIIWQSHHHMFFLSLHINFKCLLCFSCCVSSQSPQADTFQFKQNSSQEFWTEIYFIYLCCLWVDPSLQILTALNELVLASLHNCCVLFSARTNNSL